MANLQLDKISKIYSRLRNLLLYGLFGMTAALVDYAVFFIIIYFQLGETEWLASVLGNICGFIVSFSLNTFINFKKSNHLFYRFVSYFIICVIGSAFSTIVFIRIDGLLNLYVSKILVMGLACIMQFMLNKIITYRK